MNNEGGITWNLEASSTPHYDHVEMSGKNISTVLRYGVDADGKFVLNKSLIWPMLRTIPNNTHASLMRRYDWNPIDAVTVNGRSLTGEKVKEISLKGVLKVKSEFDQGYYGKYELIRDYFPSTEQPALIEIYNLVNKGDRPMTVEIADSRMSSSTDPVSGVTGSYKITGAVDSHGYFSVLPGDTVSFSASISAVRDGENAISVNAGKEKAKRSELVDEWMNTLVLETPDPVIDRMFAFSKIRACESIYDTKGGPMHGPGGESYYAAIWANDQAEYINPYFPFTGYAYGNASALNSFRHFARFMNNEMKPIPSSIVAEGLDIWNGVGDRGDAAMIAHGASRYALARGDLKEGRELWPLIEWCLDYCKGKLNKDGVVESDTDELENRFESGNANLCTSSLYYDALVSASCLARDLGIKNWKKYQSEAKTLRADIEKYFGKDMGGFETYAYYEGNDKLRAWICIPLAMGIDDRATQTLDALFSPRLWTENGLLSEEGDRTFWDRATLYALRGAYTVGETKRATDFLHDYSQTRLLGEHVPYAIEAWPEGSQRHLSAESGLYGRIITEGLFGIRPTGFRSFTLTPHLPSGWDHMSLRHIRAFGSDFDIEVRRINGDKLCVNLINGNKTRKYTVNSGKAIEIKL
uniref:Alpha-L-rhamnosidase six-hairpin glycosidase domain-containing protein n=1 Tax=uncultured Muribaculaceae bacterium TaxID=2301481 RepID=A0A6G8F433_9BACT|nr:hypothetical protein Muribac1_0970 [uncultured Muribaculaceae bacterium]